MTNSELREIIESQGLAGMNATIFTRNRAYIGRVARINVTTLMLIDPKYFEVGEHESREIIAMPSIADAVEEDKSGGLHRYVAIATEDIEAIGF
ncbi:MAG TPA: hypothetical protein VGK02_09580 [Candidatus Aquicultor sp.]|jgi:hypothetical protein